jgi:CheY-like chemotaxis protein
MNEKRILVVEDDRDLLQMLGDGIEAYCSGCRVVLARDGLAALEKLKEGTFDLILTDHYLPYLNGLDLAYIVRRNMPDTPVVIMTGHLLGAQVESQIKALHPEALLQKPFGLTEIRSILHTTLQVSPN